MSIVIVYCFSAELTRMPLNTFTYRSIKQIPFRPPSVCWCMQIVLSPIVRQCALGTFAGPWTYQPEPKYHSTTASWCGRTLIFFKTNKNTTTKCIARFLPANRPVLKLGNHFSLCILHERNMAKSRINELVRGVSFQLGSHLFKGSVDGQWQMLRWLVLPLHLPFLERWRLWWCQRGCDAVLDTDFGIIYAYDWFRLRRSLTTKQQESNLNDLGVTFKAWKNAVIGYLRIKAM